MQPIYCPQCNNPVLNEQEKGDSCWCSCLVCNVLFPSPIYEPDSADTEVRLPFEIIRSMDRLEFRYPATGMLASATKKRLAIWTRIIRTIVFAWILVWIILCYRNISLGKEIPDLIGFFLASSIFIGFIWFLWISWLVLSQTSLVFDKKGATRWTKGLFFSYYDTFIPREKYISLALRSYEDRNKITETEYGIDLYYFPDLKRDQLGGELNLLRGSFNTDQFVADRVASEFVNFHKSLKPLKCENGVGGIFDRQLRGMVSCFDLYCPICRARHQIQEKEYAQYYGRLWFDCLHCHASIDLAKSLFCTGTEPPQRQQSRKCPRNRIVLPGQDEYSKENLILLYRQP